MENRNHEKFLELLEDALFLQNSNVTEVNTVKVTTDLMSDATVLVEQMFASGVKPSECIVDAKVLAVSTNLLTDRVKSIDGNLYAFNEDLFVESIMEYICRGPVHETLPDWNRLCTIADGCCNKTMSLDYMLGTFKPGDREPKQRKERAVKQAVGPVVKPQNVALGEKQEDGIEDSLQLVMRVLSRMHRRNNNKPICYFTLVVNPDSFGATVENIYHLSFLVKDGLVKLSLDENGLPVITPKPKKAIAGDDGKRKRPLEDQDTNQCIISWSFQDWEDIKETFQITEAKIPRRDNTDPTTSQR